MTKTYQWDAGKENRYQYYLEKVDIYIKKHGITREQFASIFVENLPDNWRSLFWTSGEDSDFKYRILGK